jgi:hypothetical protein
VNRVNQEDGYQIARALLLVGGIVALAFGATALGISLSSPRGVSGIVATPGPLLTTIVGVVAMVASSRVKEEAINVVVAVLGFIAGGIGGVLVAIAGLWAIISRYTLKG